MDAPTGKKTATSTTTLATTVVAAVAFGTSTVAASLAIGLFAAQPFLRPRGVFRIAVVAGAPAPALNRTIPFSGKTAEGSEATAVEVTADSGYIVVGWTKTDRSDKDVLLIKAYGYQGDGNDANEGHEQWVQSFGGGGNDIGYSVVPTVDQRGGHPTGYVVAGFTETNVGGNTDQNVYLIRTDLSGKLDPSWLQNPKTIGVGTVGEIALGVRQTFDVSQQSTGYIVGGFSSVPDGGETTALLIKVDNGGSPEWSKTFTAAGSPTIANAVAATYDAAGSPTGYVLAGETTQAPGNRDAFLLKTDIFGNREWGMTYGGGGLDFAKTVRPTLDAAGNPDGFILTGKTAPTENGIPDALVIKTNLTGQLDGSWPKNPATFGAEGSDFAQDIRQTIGADGKTDGYVIGGGSGSPQLGATDGVEYYLARTDLLGNEIWHLLISDTRYNALNGVVQNGRGAFVGVGQTQGWTISGQPAAVLVLTQPESGHAVTDVNFRRADADGNEQLDITDAIVTLQYLFLGGARPTCEDATDSDDTGKLDITDVIYSLYYQFLGGEVPPDPGPPPNPPGPDPPPTDELGCKCYPFTTCPP